MKRLIVYSLPLIAFVLYGCTAARVIPRDMERVDQELKGNRGIVTGTASHLPEPPERKKTRRIYDLEVELLSSEDLKKPEEKKIDVQKDKVYLEKKKGSEEKAKPAREGKDSTVLGMPQLIYQGQTGIEGKYKKEKGVVTLIKEDKTQKVYVVEKGDTLQGISDKVYGTTKKWKEIYEANRDVLESPDMIRPGQKLVIPE